MRCVHTLTIINGQLQVVCKPLINWGSRPGNQTVEWNTTTFDTYTNWSTGNFAWWWMWYGSGYNITCKIVELCQITSWTRVKNFGKEKDKRNSRQRDLSFREEELSQLAGCYPMSPHKSSLAKPKATFQICVYSFASLSLRGPETYSSSESVRATRSRWRICFWPRSASLLLLSAL